jgi:thiamine-phosphate pyrophosphorylase
MISDRKLLKVPITEVAAEADHASVDYFQLREKDLGPRDLLHLAQEIRRHLRRTLFIINGSLDVALASKSDGVHLQKDNIPVAAVRSVHPTMVIGYSAHTFEEMKEAEAAGADYVFISPVFQPLSKSVRDVSPPHDVSSVSRWAGGVKIPVYALGGITSTRLQQLKDSGCRGVAGISLFLKDGRFTSAGMVL